MMQPTSPPVTPRTRPRVPSGPRGPRDGHGSGRSVSTASIPLTGSSRPTLRNQTSVGSLAILRDISDSPLDTLIDAEHDFTLSPETSPKLEAKSPPSAGPTSPVKRASSPTAPLKSPERGRTFGLLTGRIRDASATRSQTAPLRPSTPTSSTFVVSRPSTPVQSPPAKIKPKPSRLNTLNLLGSSASPTKPLSPGVKHWQQVRNHVLAPTPVEERPAKQTKKLNIVSKAAGRFGFRHAADTVIGYDDRRRSVAGNIADIEGLSAEQQEEIARERRKFARDVKGCLDACAAEETHRRLFRAGAGGTAPSTQSFREPPKSAASMHGSKSAAGSVHSSQHLLSTKYSFDPNFSSFAPLLTELHRYLPAARARKLWSRTCPHHAAILAELGVSFLPDSTSTDGERQQALEVFGVVVRNWSADSAQEELDRWSWLCQALVQPDRQLRSRGLGLLSSLLDPESPLPPPHDRPHTAVAFQAIALDLLRLLCVLEGDGAFQEHSVQVSVLLGNLVEGNTMELELKSLEHIFAGSVDDFEGGLGGVEKELLWNAIGRNLGRDRRLAAWLLQEQAIERFLPDPLLHATPPLLLRLRSLSCSAFLATLGGLVEETPRWTTSVWQFAQYFILSDVEQVVGNSDELTRHLASFCLHLEVAGNGSGSSSPKANPFRTCSPPTTSVLLETRVHLAKLLNDKKKRQLIFHESREMTAHTPLAKITPVICAFLQNQPLVELGRDLACYLLELPQYNVPCEEVQSFQRYLQSTHPQLLYKPLFSLSATTSPVALQDRLRTVRSISTVLGADGFWFPADPQMVVIVLMGDVAPREAKGKAKEGEVALIPVRLGRYACLIELLSALQILGPDRSRDKATRKFLEAVETRLGLMLDAEAKQGTHPDLYAALILKLVLQIRYLTRSTRKPTWLRLAMAWFLRPCKTVSDDNGIVATLRSTFSAMSNSFRTDGTDDSRPNTTRAVQRTNSAKTSEVALVEQMLESDTTGIVTALLVAIHPALHADDWRKLLPDLWARCGTESQDDKAVAFLLMKCGEIVPDDLRDFVISQFYVPTEKDRIASLRKLVCLYNWRYQVLAQLALTDRRGPIYQFTARTLEFVATEIGSLTWIPPHDVRDAALQKFGTALPLELRQKLMELGWSEDDTININSDAEQIPLSTLSSLHHQVEAIGAVEGGRPSSPSAGKGLNRHASNASGSSQQSKRRKAIFAPMLLTVIAQQSAIFAHDPNSLVASASLDLTRVLQRDDPALLLRPFTDGLSFDFPAALASLNAVISTSTPGFAYIAFNAIVGYLKTVLRTTPAFTHYAFALATIAHLVPKVSGISLRDIRKNKAEHVLLPASIHEEEGEFKLHAPWQDESYEVQTAQLLILVEILNANPRDVYLVKKLLSKLPIRTTISHPPFARAWLLLITSLFSSVNRNYNDRAELRHFLSNVVEVLHLHGISDPLIVAHSMRVFALCSARFRRLFASMGFPTVMRSVYETYAKATDNSAIRHGIEHTMRSFYRIHQESFVYTTCAVIAEGDFNPTAAYDLLCCLSMPSASSADVSSGLKGMNDREELEALVQMISGPELTLTEIGTAASERQAAKMSMISLDDKLFPKDNIIKLFVTAIAANPTTNLAVRLSCLFAGLIPFIKHQQSLALLHDGIDALASVMVKGKTSDETMLHMFYSGTDEGKTDWTLARQQYVVLVESFARSGGRLTPSAMKKVLEMIFDLLRKQPDSIGPIAASIVRELAKTHLSGGSTRSLAFLRDIAPLFKMFVAEVDFSGLLAEITSLIVREGNDVDEDLTTIIIYSYVHPCVHLLASASGDDAALLVPLQTCVVDLLATAVYLKGDALDALEACPVNHNLLAAVILPLILTIEPSTGLDGEVAENSIWVRLLNYVIHPPALARHTRRTGPASPAAMAAQAVLSLQAIKLISIRGRRAVTSVHGMWTYLSQHLAQILEGGSSAFLQGMDRLAMAPRPLDWMMWTTYELLSLHRSELMVEMRHQVQVSLAADQTRVSRIVSSTPGLEAFSPRPRMSSSPMIGGRMRMPSMARIPSSGRSPAHSPSPEPQLASSLTPDSAVVASASPRGHSRMPSQHLTPYLGHGRMPSGSSPLGQARPSFADLSARRASRPAVALPGGKKMDYRFPSSQPVRSLPSHAEKGGAIVHLLGAPNQVLSATSAGIPTLNTTGQPAAQAASASKAIRDLKLNCEKLAEGTKRAITACQIVFGYSTGGESVDEHVKIWSDHDAIQAISEQTRIFIEEEYRELFIPSNRTRSSVSDRMNEKDGDAVGQAQRNPSTYANNEEGESKEWLDSENLLDPPMLRFVSS